MSESIDKIFKVCASILLVGAILFYIIPNIFGIILHILFELVSLIVWGLFGYIVIKGIEYIWRSDKKVKL